MLSDVTWIAALRFIVDLGRRDLSTSPIIGSVVNEFGMQLIRLAKSNFIFTYLAGFMLAPEVGLALRLFDLAIGPL